MDGAIWLARQGAVSSSELLEYRYVIIDNHSIEI